MRTGLAIGRNYVRDSVVLDKTKERAARTTRMGWIMEWSHAQRFRERLKSDYCLAHGQWPRI